MKVLVTGGTGFVGREILRQLDSAGHLIRILARQPDAARTQKIAQRHRAEVVPGDVLDLDRLRAAAAEVNAVIHLVGIISEIGENTFERVHARGAANIVDAAQRAGVRRVIHMSALGTRPNAVSRYHKSKWAGEEAVRNSGLDYTIFRPSLIYGPGDGFVSLFERMTRWSPAVPIMGTGKSLLQFVPVQDVARCFVRALDEPRAIGQVYDVVGLESLTFEHALEVILEVTGRRRWKPHVPLPLARALAASLEIVYPTLLRKAPPLNRDSLIMLQEDTVGQAQPAWDLFGIHPPPFREGVSSYLRTGTD